MVMNKSITIYTHTIWLLAYVRDWGYWGLEASFVRVRMCIYKEGALIDFACFAQHAIYSCGGRIREYKIGPVNITKYTFYWTNRSGYTHMYVGKCSFLNNISLNFEDSLLMPMRHCYGYCHDAEWVTDPFQLFCCSSICGHICIGVIRSSYLQSISSYAHYLFHTGYLGKACGSVTVCQLG